MYLYVCCNKKQKQLKKRVMKIKEEQFFIYNLGKSFEDFKKEADKNSSGYSSTSASSGNSSTSASSGNYSTSECSGENSSSIANGIFSKVKGGTNGSLIGCTEYDSEGTPISIAYGIVGKDVKVGVWYLAYKGKLVELITVDGIGSGIIYKRKNVMKVVNSDMTEGYIVTNEGGISAHGKTISEAREALIYKVTDRDLSELEHLTKDSVLDFKEAIEAYHSVTGACSEGMKLFITDKGLKRESYKVSDIIELSSGAYGSQRFKDFIEKK